MKNKLLIFLIVLITIVTFYLSVLIGNRINKEKTSQIIPEFPIYKLNGNQFLLGKNLMSNNKIIFCYYHPECEYCINFSEKLKKYNSNSKLYSTTFLMVSNAQDSVVNYFIKKNNLDNINNVYFIKDSNNELYKYFDIKSIPTYFIYNEKKLVSKFSGLIKLETLTQK